MFQQAGVSMDHLSPSSAHSLGRELLRPTHIYVPEILDLIARVPAVKALVHITGDGLLNLPRIAADNIGFVLDALPPPPPIFALIERLGAVPRAEMFEVYNMGIGFCVVVADADVGETLAILARHGRQAWAVGHAVADPDKSVRLPQYGLVGQGKRFRPA